VIFPGQPEAEQLRLQSKYIANHLNLALPLSSPDPSRTQKENASKGMHSGNTASEQGAVLGKTNMQLMA
jgi:hypothetical protein